MNPIEWFERTFFGGYTGSPDGRREFIKARLASQGWTPDVVDRVMREEDARLKAAGVTW